ncbi:MAG: DUF1330 domain-containing protein [SAR324 cluster bacterium]|nr:DUF1330 domain-containing protein [SAR324 cluster bacterium]
MRTVEPSEEKMNAWLNEPVDNKPIVMLNLLSFNEQANYESGALDSSPCSGKKAYDRYSKAVINLLWEIGGQILLMGKVRSQLIAPDEESWDQFMLIYYPNRDAFKKMVTSDAYKKIMHHRTAALKDSRLIETHLIKLPDIALKFLSKLTRMKALVSPRI